MGPVIQATQFLLYKLILSLKHGQIKCKLGETNKNKVVQLMVVHVFTLASCSLANLLSLVTMLPKNVRPQVVPMEEGNSSSASTDRIHSLSTSRYIKHRHFIQRC